MTSCFPDNSPFHIFQGEPTAASRLAVSIIETCAETLEPFICGFLTSCISERDVVGSELKEFYHEIIFRIFQCVPQMLLPVIPNLALELVVCHLLIWLVHFFFLFTPVLQLWYMTSKWFYTM